MFNAKGEALSQVLQVNHQNQQVSVTTPFFTGKNCQVKNPLPKQDPELHRFPSSSILVWWLENDGCLDVFFQYYRSTFPLYGTSAWIPIYMEKKPVDFHPHLLASLHLMGNVLTRERNVTEKHQKPVTIQVYPRRISDPKSLAWVMWQSLAVLNTL